MSNISNLAEAREARRLQQPHQNSGKGYALLHRKIMDVPFYKDAEAAHLWVHLILKAKHTPEYVMTDAGEILVGRGKLLGGRNSLAFETGLKPDRVQYLLRKFKKLGMIDWVSHGKFSVFSVEKYDDYQSNFVPADYQQITTSKPAIPMPASNTVPADYQQITTDKEYNNIISNTDVLESATADKKSDKKKPSVSCQDVVDAYHEILPEAPRIRALNDKRKNQIRTFWRKAGVITRQLDERNIHKQCVVCNQHKSGNLVPYRVELISRIGQEAVDEIESNHNRHRWTIEECKAIKAEYQQKLKDLRNSRSEAA